MKHKFSILCKDIKFSSFPPIPFQSISYYSAFAYFQYPVVFLHVVEMTKWQFHWEEKKSMGVVFRTSWTSVMSQQMDRADCSSLTATTTSFAPTG